MRVACACVCEREREIGGEGGRERRGGGREEMEDLIKSEAEEAITALGPAQHPDHPVLHQIDHLPSE